MDEKRVGVPMKKLKHTRGLQRTWVDCGQCGKGFQAEYINKTDYKCPFCGYQSEACDFPDVQEEEFIGTAPHVCADPKCPGDINRRKLELWDDLIHLLDNIANGAYGLTPDQWASEAMDIIKKAETIKVSWK